MACAVSIDMLGASSMITFTFLGLEIGVNAINNFIIQYHSITSIVSYELEENDDGYHAGFTEHIKCLHVVNVDDYTRALCESECVLVCMYWLTIAVS